MACQQRLVIRLARGLDQAIFLVVGVRLDPIVREIAVQVVGEARRAYLREFVDRVVRARLGDTVIGHARPVAHGIEVVGRRLAGCRDRAATQGAEFEIGEAVDRVVAIRFGLHGIVQSLGREFVAVVVVGVRHPREQAVPAVALFEPREPIVGVVGIGRCHAIAQIAREQAISQIVGILRH